MASIPDSAEIPYSPQLAQNGAYRNYLIKKQREMEINIENSLNYMLLSRKLVLLEILLWQSLKLCHIDLLEFPGFSIPPLSFITFSFVIFGSTDVPCPPSLRRRYFPVWHEPPFMLF
jgi:hypothetical protein